MAPFSGGITRDWREPRRERNTARSVSENIYLWWPTFPDKGKATVMSSINSKSDVTPTESKTTSTVENFPHGSRETPGTSASFMEANRSEKARYHSPL
jgi:hypothetical protein